MRADSLCLAAALLGFTVTVAVPFPGYMSVDSVVQLDQGRRGTYSDWHPPVMAWVWGRIDRAVAGPSGMLVLHSAVFWGSVAVLAMMRFARRPRAAAVAVLAIGFFPPIFATLCTIWKDVALGVTALAAFVLLMIADRRRSRGWIGASLPFLLYAISVRHNAAPALVPFVLWAAWILMRGGHNRIVGTLAVSGVALVLFALLLAGRLLIDAALVDERRYQVQAVLLHDLTAISIRTGRNQLPPIVQPEKPLTIDELQRIYTPERTVYLYCCDESMPRLTLVHERQTYSELQARWLAAVRDHPWQYLGHRWQVARELLGVRRQAVCLPYFVGVDENDLGVVFERTLAKRIVTRLLEAVKDTAFFRGWVYLLLSLVAVAWALARWRRHPNVPFLVLTSSAVLYFLPYYFVATTCDFRLLWWGVLAIVVSPLLIGCERDRDGGLTFVSAADPGRQQAARAEDVVARRLERADHALQIDANQLAVPLHGATGDEHGIDVRRVRIDDRGCDGVEERRGVDRVRAQQNEVGLLPGRDRTDPVVERTRTRAVDGRELEHVAVRERRLVRLVRRGRELEDPGVHQRGAHLREHVARHARYDVDAERRPHAVREQLADRRYPVPHQHLDVRRDRHAAAGLGDQPQLFVCRVGTVDVGRVIPHQAEVVQVLDMVRVDVREAKPDVDADAGPDAAREFPVVPRHLEIRVAGRSGGEGECQQLIVRREVRLSDAPDVLRMPAVAEGPPLRTRRHPVRIDRADPSGLQAADRLVGVIGCVVDVRPIEQRRDAGVQCLERAGVVPDVHVLWPVLSADPAEHDRQVVIERAAREHTSNRRLPCVPVRIHESREDDHSGRVNLLCARDVEPLPDHGDLAVLDDHVGVRDVPDVGVHRDDEAVTDHQAVCHVSSAAERFISQ